MGIKQIQRGQIDLKTKPFLLARQSPPPSSGWVRAIRLALGMSLEQLANRLGVTKQGAKAIEQREQEGGISLKVLKEAAAAMDMELVYGLVPRQGSLQATIDKRAQEVAEKIVARVHHTMELEDQAVSQHRRKQAVKDQFEALRTEKIKQLWQWT